MGIRGGEQPIPALWGWEVKKGFKWRRRRHAGSKEGSTAGCPRWHDNRVLHPGPSVIALSQLLISQGSLCCLTRPGPTSLTFGLPPLAWPFFSAEKLKPPTNWIQFTLYPPSLCSHGYSIGSTQSTSQVPLPCIPAPPTSVWAPHSFYVGVPYK